MSPKAVKGITVMLAVAVLALVTFGFVMLASTSSSYASSVHGDAFYYAKRQAIWLGLGLAVCLVVARTDYQCYRQRAWLLLIVAVGLLVAVLIFGKRINGATRWLVCGPVRFQPSEFAKYAVVIVLAFWLERMQRARKGQLLPRIRHFWWGIFTPILLAAVPAVLIYLEPDLGTTLLLAALALLMMWIAGSPPGWLGSIVGAGGLGLIAFLVAIFQFGMFQGSYQVRRIVHWWRGDDLLGINYQQFMAKVAFGSGGLDGLGLGNSRMKMAYLPEAHTDFIFPIIGEELGLVAGLAVLAAFCVIVVCGIVLVTQAPDLFGLLLGSGIVAVIGLQAIINMAVVTDLLPNKGLAMPFVSYGGSNLVMTLAALGVLLNIARQAHTHALESLVVPTAV